MDVIGTELAAIRKGLLLMLANNIGNVVEDIRRLMVDLAVSRVLFQLRSGNGVAYALAQFGLTEGTTFIWEDVASPWLESSLAKDMELGQVFMYLVHVGGDVALFFLDQISPLRVFNGKILTRPPFITGPDPNSTSESEPIANDKL